MFTVCPKCALTLVVTAADLKVAQGYVRCGRCSNVFNAISALSDEVHAPPGLEGYVQPDPPPSVAPPSPVETPVEREETPAEEKLEFDATATNVSDVFVEPALGDNDATGTFESIVLETGEADPTEPASSEAPSEEEPEKALDQELRSLAEKIEAAEATSAPKKPIAVAAAPIVIDEETAVARPQHVWRWRIGIAALALLLVAQVIHHYRHHLAVLPQLRAPLTAFYRALGVSLVPRWNLAAYEVRQLGGSVSGSKADQFVVRASVKNAAPRTQPLPLLRVAVQDRFGNRIATRDVPPSFYAPRHALLAAGQRIDVEIAFVDRADAASFEIDACLASASGAVNCANH